MYNICYTVALYSLLLFYIGTEALLQVMPAACSTPLCPSTPAAPADTMWSQRPRARHQHGAAQRSRAHHSTSKHINDAVLGVQHFWHMDKHRTTAPTAPAP
jgi:hypothetical protein